MSRFSTLALALCALVGTTDAFLAPARSFVRSKSLVAAARPTRSAPCLQMAAGLFYSTTTGNTETCAGYIAEATGLEMVDIGDADDATIKDCEFLICGAPTWHTGADEQRSGTEWDSFLYERLPSLDLTGKKIAIFGLGDQAGYGDNFCDAMGELYDLFTDKGATICGMTATDGYDHSDSKSIRDGKFVGMPFDEDNQYDLSEERAKSWVAQLQTEGMSF